MAQILVRNLDDKVMDVLKKRAKNNGRSLQSEVRIILEQATRYDMNTARKVAMRFQEKFKGRKFTDSVKLIREDRDR